MTPDTLARICARHQLSRKDCLVIVIFGYGHPGQSFTRALWAYLHGVGPAAVAMGRYVAGGVRLAAQHPPARVVSWQQRDEQTEMVA